MRLALVNFFHAGDAILSRALIKRVRPLLVDRVKLELRCKPKNMYLWSDLGLPIYPEPPPADLPTINMWFGHGGDLLGVSGLTHATQVTSYNRQAKALDLPIISPDEPVPPIDFPERPVSDNPGVLVENGPVLSGQPTHDLNPRLTRLAKAFPRLRFYCTGKVPKDKTRFSNIVDISKRNLVEISALSNICYAMLARLSGPFVASLTSRNVGRLPRLVHGSPIGCPIWDERDVKYFSDFEHLVNHLREVTP